MRDEVVEEVRRAREAYGERFNFDLEAIGRDLREQERRSGRTIVNYLSDRVEPTDDESSEEESTPTPVSTVARAS